MAFRRNHVLWGLGILALAAYLATGLYSVQSDESAVAFRLGRVVGTDVLPGMHWNAPWPFGRVVVAKTATNFIMPIGYRFQDRPDLSPVSDLWLTGDTNVITVRLTVQYSIRSLTRFVLAHENARELVRRSGERALTALLLSEGVDGVLTNRRAAVLAATQKRIQELLDELDVGITIQSLNIQELAPPVQGGVRAAFQDVQNAKADRERLIYEARASAAQVLAEARGNADRMGSEAKADRHQRIQIARGETQRFLAVAAERDKAPAITEDRLFLETIGKVVPRLDVYVLQPKKDGTVHLRIVR